MARDNYGFQKRSRELAKKKKKEEKRLRKQAKAEPEAAESPEGAADEIRAADMPAEPETPPTGAGEGAIGPDR